MREEENFFNVAADSLAGSQVMTYPPPMRNWWLGDVGMKTEVNKGLRANIFTFFIPFKTKEDLPRQVKR